MRAARLIRAAALGLALSPGLAALAQTPPPPSPAAKAGEGKQAILYTATVKDAEAEVRSGASDDPKMYATNRLRQGEVVEVVGELPGGWLAIKPPPESFSWINKRFVEQLSDTTWFVRIHNDALVDVLVGSRVADQGQRPTIIGAKLRRGAIVASFWNAKVAEDGYWLPIVPPPAEVRYIKATAVAKAGAPAVAPAPPAGGPGTPDATVSWDGGGNGGPAGPPAPVPARTPPPASVPAPPLAPVTHPKWAEAEQFERDGKKVEAERTYRELGNAVCNKNHDLAMRCYNRAEFLRGGAAASVPSGYQPNRPAVASSMSGHEVRLHPVPTTAGGSPMNCVPCPPPASAAASVASFFSGPRAQPTAAQPTGFGYLRNSGFRVDNKRTYAWESPHDPNLRLYVTEGPGVNLEPYVNRTVELFGEIVRRNDLRGAFYMVTIRVTPQP